MIIGFAIREVHGPLAGVRLTSETVPTPFTLAPGVWAVEAVVAPVALAVLGELEAAVVPDGAGVPVADAVSDGVAGAVAPPTVTTTVLAGSVTVFVVDPPKKTAPAPSPRPSATTAGSTVDSKPPVFFAAVRSGSGSGRGVSC
ncbi:hypothetical protein GCM10009838_77960 [Catenulispora subtropica]|uniref:Uncharacterized protein n=1 Tax=Catenulispora subtropica TaxID=450798 RepID=A0ABN2T7E7_9ACTN